MALAEAASPTPYQHLKDKTVLVGASWRELSSLPVVGRDDIIATYQPKASVKDYQLIEGLLSGPYRSSIEEIDAAYEIRLRELHELKFPGVEWDEFKHQRMTGFGGFWVHNLATGVLRRTLERDDFFTVFTSRLYPLLSKSEIARMIQSTVLFLGLSTGSPVLKASIQLSLGNVIGVDPDHVSLSNTTRMEASDEDVAINKAVIMAHRVTQLNPHAKFLFFTRPLSEKELKSYIAQADLAVEMTEDFWTKYHTRLEGRAAHKGVAMGTGTGWQPVLTLEEVGDAFFQQPNLTSGDIDILLTSKDFVAKTRSAIKVIGLENVPARQMVNFILAAKGKLRHWSQLGPTASATASGLAFIIVQRLNGRSTVKEKVIDLPTLLQDDEGRRQADQEYLLELQNDHPDVFAGYQTLEEATVTLYQQIFEN